MIDRKYAAFLAAGLLLAGVLIGAAIVRREKPAAVTPASEQAERNPEKDLALAFYKADVLAQDPEAAWEMMHPLLRSRGLGDNKVGYLAGERQVTRMEVPQDLLIREWRRPQQDAYTYLFQAKEMDPVVIVITHRDDGTLSVLKSWFWKGEELP